MIAPINGIDKASAREIASNIGSSNFDFLLWGILNLWAVSKAIVYLAMLLLM